MIKGEYDFWLSGLRLRSRKMIRHKMQMQYKDWNSLPCDERILSIKLEIMDINMVKDDRKLWTTTRYVLWLKRSACNGHCSPGHCTMYVLHIISVRGIRLLCHFRTNDRMPVISCLTSLTFWSLLHVISILFCPNTFLGPKFLKE